MGTNEPRGGKERGLRPRGRVLDAVRQYQYYPNLSAQLPAGKTTDTLGLFFINQGHFSEDVPANYLISSIIENAASLGYHTLSYLIRNPEDIATANSIREVFCQRRICAGISIGARNHEAVVEELISEAFSDQRRGGFFLGLNERALPGKAGRNARIGGMNGQGIPGQQCDHADRDHRARHREVVA